MSKIIKYRIDRITKLGYEIAEKDGFQIPGEDCEVNLQLGSKFAIPESEIGLILRITYTDKRDKQKLLTFSMEVIFKVDNYIETLDVVENKVTIPDNFLADMLSVAIGAARGMLVELNNGTYLERTYVPVFNVGDILAGIKQSQKNKETQQP